MVFLQKFYKNDYLTTYPYFFNKAVHEIRKRRAAELPSAAYFLTISPVIAS